MRTVLTDCSKPEICKIGNPKSPRNVHFPRLFLRNASKSYIFSHILVPKLYFLSSATLVEWCGPLFPSRGRGFNSGTPRIGSPDCRGRVAAALRQVNPRPAKVWPPRSLLGPRIAPKPQNDKQKRGIWASGT